MFSRSPSAPLLLPSAVCLHVPPHVRSTRRARLDSLASGLPLAARVVFLISVAHDENIHRRCLRVKNNRPKGSARYPLAERASPRRPSRSPAHRSDPGPLPSFGRARSKPTATTPELLLTGCAWYNLARTKEGARSCFVNGSPIGGLNEWPARQVRHQSSHMSRFQRRSTKRPPKDCSRQSRNCYRRGTEQFT